MKEIKVNILIIFYSSFFRETFVKLRMGSDQNKCLGFLR